MTRLHNLLHCIKVNLSLKPWAVQFPYFQKWCLLLFQRLLIFGNLKIATLETIYNFSSDTGWLKNRQNARSGQRLCVLTVCKLCNLVQVELYKWRVRRGWGGEWGAAWDPCYINCLDTKDYFFNSLAYLPYCIPNYKKFLSSANCILAVCSHVYSIYVDSFVTEKNGAKTKASGVPKCCSKFQNYFSTWTQRAH